MTRANVSALTQPKPHWYPKEQLSPTQLSMFAQCRRKWTLAYLFGIKEGKRGKSKLLGSVIHACLEAYQRGGNVYDPDLRELERELAHLTDRERADLLAEGPRRAIVAVPFIPKPGEADLYPEQKYEGVCAVSDILEETAGDPLRFVLKLDLLAMFHATCPGDPGAWFLYDYKSTKGKRVTGKGFDPWFYVPTVEALQHDVQAIFYALEAMLRLGLDEIWCRWVYTNTDPKELPVSKCVDFHMTREHCQRQIEPWLVQACEMRRQVRESMDRNGPPEFESVPAPSALPPAPDSPCDAYGGCPYRAKALGPCDPGHGSIGLAVLRAKQPQPKEEKTVMSLEDRVHQAVQSGAASLPHNAPEGYTVDPAGDFPVYSGEPVGEPTGEAWIDEASGQPFINGKGERLDTAGNPMPRKVTPPAAVRPPVAVAPPVVAPPAARVGDSIAIPPPPPVAAPKVGKAPGTRRPRQKTGESAEDFAVRLAEYNGAKGVAPSDAAAEHIQACNDADQRETETAGAYAATREVAHEVDGEIDRLAPEQLSNMVTDTSAAALLKFFACSHLPDRLQAVVGPFGALAVDLVNLVPSSAERTMALRKLLEAKDCAVRAAL